MKIRSITKGNRALYCRADGWWYGYWNGPVYGYPQNGSLELVTMDKDEARHWWKSPEVKRLRPYKKRKSV